MKKSISRIIGLIMLIIAIVFIVFALNHPEKSFPWNNTITWLLYGVYFLVTVKSIYKDNAETIEGSCDTFLFLGGKEKSTLTDLSEVLGK